MSVLSPSREISGEILSHYIPHDPESTELAPVSKGGSYSYESEREILYKILYELRGNVSDLRRDMNSLRKQIDEARGLNGATGFQNPIIAPTETSITGIQPATLQPQPLDAEAEIIEAEEEDSDLNLTSLGRQMLEKALRMANGNRKKAAAALGISDRTLYRRIKQYGL